MDPKPKKVWKVSNNTYKYKYNVEVLKKASNYNIILHFHIVTMHILNKMQRVYNTKFGIWSLNSNLYT